MSKKVVDYSREALVRDTAKARKRLVFEAIDAARHNGQEVATLDFWVDQDIGAELNELGLMVKLEPYGTTFISWASK